VGVSGQLTTSDSYKSWYLVYTKSSFFMLARECKVDVPRVRIGNRQTIGTLISEEALLFAEYFRDERKT